ncbi:hypothetical protein DL89DRAFT_268718 [Linderina pennispora]|uniref:Alanine--tRNA ligase n=1 Tax=Linderina pennispora TaxID=61395 RepID=A0A1Y1W3U6_9FUNG|nr:uncharacterized protein DL89DRAFT_268718 [Linderina pennispora]ORX68191.1 hypothetical protein DL89DRAFT_268718 [Linderina pennispora]
MSASEIRRRYLEFFERNGHKRQPSSDIVPKNDSTLLFTNAGMVPFKQYFKRPDTAPFKQVTTVQKCGQTPRHHTFFEMLGNFSFGAYGKREIIHMAWRFITEELQLPQEKLRVTVHTTDQEAYAIWRDEIKLDPLRIVRLGDEDNFWSMGAGEGPCGLSSEIFWDTGNPRYTEHDEERWLEFWNLVFMENYRDANRRAKQAGCAVRSSGSLVTLQKGETDPLTHKRVIADHLRTSAFLISEGVYPGNTGRGYVLRRIIRRAVRAGRLLGITGPILPTIYPSLEQAMGAAYPELTERRQAILNVLAAEENAFLGTLGKGMALLEGIFTADRSNKTVSARDTFVLYDTHGFPADLTEIIARDHGWAVDVRGFEEMQRESRQRNKASWKQGAAEGGEASELEAVRMAWQEDVGVASRFSGYRFDPESDIMEETAKVVTFRALANGDGVAVIDPCPFYAAGGGQVADWGSGRTHEFTVSDAQRLSDGRATILYLPSADASLLKPGTTVTASVDTGRRLGSAVHHTATHLLHAALRQVLGASVLQAGSQVEPGSLRFDFSSAPVTQTQLTEIADIVNQAALKNALVRVKEMPLAEAKAHEKYNEKAVRVVEIAGHSLELCGGTHVLTTGNVFPFQIVSEGSAWLQKQLTYATATAAMEDKAQKLQLGQRAAIADAERWRQIAAENLRAFTRTVDFAGTPVAIHVLPDARLVKARVEHLCNAEPPSVHLAVLGRAGVHAGRLLAEVFKVLPGRGGGQGAIAQGQFRDPVDAELLLFE